MPITAANCTFTFSAGSAMCRTGRAASAASVTGYGVTAPFAIT
ncbi:hypothetical protein [Streptomyces lucensis]|nr:hypothetical protein [Streptomyces lucensis]